MILYPLLLWSLCEAVYKVPKTMVLVNPTNKLVKGRTQANMRSKTDWEKQTVKPFVIDITPVTNKGFADFVKKKSFVTEAEKFGWSFVFEMFVAKEVAEKITQSVKGAEWWLPVEKAYWRHPSGPGTNCLATKGDYPAVHISYNDAAAYCKHKGLRLPTEEEWEYAARGGMRDQVYPWGNLYEEKRMNIWQGKFPKDNKGKDGYIGVAPVKAFPPQNNYGLYDMVGNIWEWTSTVFGKDRQTKQEQYTLRGGSYIDSRKGEFNHLADVTTRMGNTPDAGSDNIGFRCAKSISKSDANTLTQKVKQEL